jgi:hypothetical protein
VKTWVGPINSPQAAVLAPLTVGDRLNVAVNRNGVRPVLEVSDAAGRMAGSLTFRGYLELIDCILIRGATYAAVLTNIAGGVHEVRVDRL